MEAQKQGALTGALTADALALPAHWIYDTAKISEQFGRITTMLAPPAESYHAGKQLGEFTHYGDQTKLLLDHILENEGRFSLNVFADKWQKYMTGYNGYKDRATKTTLENLAAGNPPLKAGSSSSDLGGAVRIVSLVTLAKGSDQELEEAVVQQTRFTHNSTPAHEAALFLMRSCQSIFSGASPREAITAAIEAGIGDIDLDMKLRGSLEIDNVSVADVVKQFGAACGVNSALPGAVFIVLQHENDLRTALIENVMAGGDSAARGQTIGMLLGAYHGIEKIPEDWVHSLNCYQQLAQLW